MNLLPAPEPEQLKVDTEPAQAVSLKPSELKNGIQVHVSHPNNLNDFYVCADQDALRSLQEKLANCQTILKQFNPSAPNQLVVARSSKFEEHFRGKVCKVNVDKKKAQIYYLDYGNKEIVMFDNIFMMPKSLAEFPELAIHCSLAVQVLPNKKPDLLCLSSKSEQGFKVDIIGKEKDQYMVDLTENGKSLRKCLVQEGIIEDPEKSGRKDEPKTMTVKSPPSKTAPTVTMPSSVVPHKMGEQIQVIVSDAGRFDSLYIQIIEPASYAENITGLMQYLNERYASGPRLDGNHPEVGNLVVAQFSDQSWYRAVVQQTGEEGASVHFIDYGNVETVTYEQMSTIDKVSAAYEVQAVPCFLRGVTLSPNAKWDPTEIPTFVPMYAVFLGKHGDKYEIQLLDGEAIDQAEVLKSHELVVAGTPHYKGSKTHNESSAGAGIPKYAIPPFYTPAEVDQPHKLHMIDKSPKGDLYIVIQEQRVIEYMDILESTLKETYFGKEIPSFDAKVGDFVVARYNIDQMYYRAVIQQISGDDYTVLFIDYGNTEIVRKTDIKPVISGLQEYPRLAMKCWFENCVMTELADGFLQGATDCYIKHISPDVYEVDLLASGDSIRDQLIAKNILQVKPKLQAQLTSASPSLQGSELYFKDSMPAPVIRQDQVCLIVHVESPTVFYLQLSPDG